MSNPNIKPGPGRPKGLPNKINRTLQEKLELMGCDPAKILGEIASNPANKLDIRERAASSLMKYIYAVKKDVEVTGKDGESLIPTIIRVMPPPKEEINDVVE